MGNLLEGKTAIVTGGASGLGLATVELFIKEGAQVVIGDVQEEAGKKLAGKFGGNAIFVHTDVTQESSIESS
jgi:NAD(P)-dependent dehydrogenase (short-subunit alcohol dehydrogenase family)